MGNAQSLQGNTTKGIQNNGQKAADAARTRTAGALDGVNEGTTSMGERIDHFAENVRESLPDSVGDAKDSVVDGFRSGGEYLRTHDIDEMSSDVTELVRNHPLLAVGIGAGVGFALGRLMMSK